MWRQAKVTVGDQTADQAMVDFDDRTPAKPQVLEWPVRLDLNTEINVGAETRFAAGGLACAGQFHIPLMAKRRLSKSMQNLKQYQPEPEQPVAAEPVEPAPEPVHTEGQ